MAGLQEKAIENLLCLIPTKVFMRKNEKSISSSILRSIILSISTDICYSLQKIYSKIDPNIIKTFFEGIEYTT